MFYLAIYFTLSHTNVQMRVFSFLFTFLNGIRIDNKISSKLLFVVLREIAFQIARD